MKIRKGKMKKRSEKLKSFVFLIFVFCFSFSVFHFAAAQVTGLEFLNIPAEAKIGDVIAALYVYGVGFVALAAFIVFTAGGVQYIFAGDKDPSKAKEWMWNAFWGLVLALTSWLILYTINPALVKNVGNLGLQKIQTQNSGDGGLSSSTSGGFTCPTGISWPTLKECNNNCPGNSCSPTPSGGVGENQSCNTNNIASRCRDGLVCAVSGLGSCWYPRNIGTCKNSSNTQICPNPR